MPKTVATLEGDSSKLVKAIADAKSAMEGMDGSARKLSDQIRDVTDEADKAAGALVQRIGGPTAVKAIAGIGVAFVGAQQALGAFSGSMSAFYSTQGEAGAKAMADIDAALNEMQSQLFTAVMGTDDLTEATETLIDVIKIATGLFQAALSPIRLVSEAIRSWSDNSEKITGHQRDLIGISESYIAAINAERYATQLQKADYDDLVISLGNVVRSKQEDAAIELQTTLTRIDNQRMANQEAKAYRANIAANRAAAIVEADLVASGIASVWDKAERELRVVNDGVRQSDEDIRARAREMLLADATFQKNLLQNTNAAREQAIRETEVMTEEEKQRDRDLLTHRENVQQKYDELRMFGEGGGFRPAPSAPSAPSGPPKKSAAEIAMERAKELATTLRSEIRKATEGINSDAEEAAKKAENAMASAIETLNKRIGAASSAANNAVQKTNAEIDAIKGQFISYGHMFGDVIGQMIAEEKKAGEIIAAIGRKAIGAVINALGDEAMAKAAIAFWSGNLPAAAGFAAAGTAAYATASVLGYSGKKAASSTPAAAAAPTQVNQSVSYNLQVDAAFANGESIARQFAMAQREANRRGMVPAGVF
jgi:hypothetical protein